ncbi:MAG: fructosamine kinase family protein, partial [Actinomycetota bacterium]
TAARRVAGGDINRALLVELAGGRRLFVKHRPGAPAGAFRAEADDLAWLAAAPGGPRVPEVVAVGQDPVPFLALEWVAPGAPGADRDARLGRELAALHRAGAPRPGRDGDNWIGSLPQPNAPCADWPEFFAERRLRPLVARTVAEGRLPAAARSAAERLTARLGDLCGPPEPPARLHGDLWGGNAMTGPDGAPVLVDPAAYGGHREVDLAMMRLFGGFPPAVFAAYDEAFPLAAGHEDRVALYQLYPLVVHVALFGGGYADRFMAALRRYAG